MGQTSAAVEEAARTLVLNVGYDPVRVVPWTAAVTMLWLEKADVVSEYPAVIRSQTIEIQMPAVLRLRKRQRKTGAVRFKRRYVFARDRWTCQYCGERFVATGLTYDHVLPRARGGKTRWENIVTSCGPCNHEKANRTPEEAGMKLLKRPKKPRWMPAVIARALESGEPVPAQWEQWVQWLL
jgi:5-methylcytosine-specific restriction endonuclease McrA